MKLKIDKSLFRLAFERDIDFHDCYLQHAYLDLSNADIVWVMENDEHAEIDWGVSKEENKEKRNAIASEPDRYIRIPGRSHGEHHGILQSFLNSDWTDNQNLRNFARNAYFGSIGGWREAIGYDQEIIDAYENYKDTEIKRRINEFLDGHGLIVDWH